MVTGVGQILVVALFIRDREAIATHMRSAGVCARQVDAFIHGRARRGKAFVDVLAEGGRGSS